ncbi:DUF2695 domain-containing protein [Fictibacillus iocasae]|uniref:DUF2695 domain-containing protein n=1 Tax=Fictibacillus iocasae TaxID=2715437 RepID=A0ABW2NQ23_9BACL
MEERNREVKELSEWQETLKKGQMLSMQGSYRRRRPDKEAVPYLLHAREGLKEYTAEHLDNQLAWCLLSQAEECLLNYRAAIECMQRVLELGKKDKKDLKRFAMLKEYGGQWKELDLQPEERESLGASLEQQLRVEDCDHTLVYTKKWVDDHIPAGKKAKVIKAITNQGGFCDCEVLANVVD